MQVYYQLLLSAWLDPKAFLASVGEPRSSPNDPNELSEESLVLNCGVSCFADSLTEYSQGTPKPYLQTPFHIFHLFVFCIDFKHSLLCVGKSEHQKNISTSMYFYYFSFNMASSVLLNHRLKWNLTQFLQG